MTEIFGEAWSPMSVPDLAPDDDDDRYQISSRSGFMFSLPKFHRPIILRCCIASLSNLACNIPILVFEHS